VLEVLDYSSVTKIPGTPDFPKGVINLRGRVILVVDLHALFRMKQVGKTLNPCIVVMEMTLDGETIPIGGQADSVTEVFQLKPEDIEPPPRIGTGFATEFISGIGKRDSEFVIILDVERVFRAGGSLLPSRKSNGGPPGEELTTSLLGLDNLNDILTVRKPLKN